ncbi:MAG: nucleotidyltransferase domain-containing protein [Desulfovibrio sp.]|nr:nucleotidyltransferase domain-containing protein [Desulfovibrio sp.]
MELGIEKCDVGELDINGWELRKALKLYRRSNPPLFQVALLTRGLPTGKLLEPSGFKVRVLRHCSGWVRVNQPRTRNTTKQ